jgi:hypothetical protein
MNKSLRKNFNENFSTQKYQNFLSDIHQLYPNQLEFRVAETPVFVPKNFKNKLIDACESIIDVIVEDDFKLKTLNAIPKNQIVPKENNHTSFLAIDFAVCEDSNGELFPQLIELQGFPSLFGFQFMIAQQFQKHYNIPENYDFLLNDLTKTGYVEHLKTLIVGNENPENVILLEVYPEKQKTKIDFKITEELLGVKVVCITKIIKEGCKLFYFNEEHKTPIHRIYNRLIFDDLSNYPDLKTEFNFTDEVEVEWVGHPNWFFRISKYCMPFLKNQYVPECRFLSEYNGVFPENLKDFVLKPLFSFAGSGVIINVLATDLESIKDPENYILQKKVKYEPVVETIDNTKVKCEIRMLYVWQKEEMRPVLLTNLARLSRGEMIGVRFNKDFDWVGGSVCFMEK